MSKDGDDLALCPYCALPLNGRGGPTREHVFTEALGGQTTITVCKQCNATLGHEVEGRLMRHDQILNLARAAYGLPSAPIRGTTDTGQGVDWDGGTGEVSATRPITKRTTDQGEVLAVRTSPEHAERILRGQGRSQEEIARLLASATRSDWSDERVKIALNVDLPRQYRLAAKVALGAGVLWCGLDFTTSALAQALRGVLWEKAPTASATEPFEPIPVQALSALDEYMRQLAARLGGDVPAPVLSSMDSVGHVIFWPQGQSTGIFVRLLGTMLGATGVLYPASLPGPHHLAVSVRDVPPNGEVRHIGGEFIDALRQAET